MQRGRGLGGYTIVEVMIFLAISGFMFVLAAYFIQGKQTNAQFIQAINSINTSVQQVINNVNDNNYPELNEQCTTISGTSLSITPYGTSGSTNEQGSNLGCIVLGQVIQFGVNNTNGQGYNIYTVAGCQYVLGASCTQNFIDGSPPQSFSSALATVVDPGPATQCGLVANKVNLTSCDQLEWGLHTTAMYDYTNNAASTNSIGFFESFAPQAPSGQGLISGSQNVEVVDTGWLGANNGINISSSSTDNVDEAGMVSRLNPYLVTDPSYIANPYFVVCFSDGHGHVGALSIGGGNSTAGSSGQRVTTSIQISDATIHPFPHSPDACTAS